jgi:pimeloyl-ACP methyl ester carboxylesterase
MRLSPLLGLLLAAPAAAEYADLHGIHMYYEVRGQGPTVVLLHGGLATIRLSFEKQIPILARSHRVVALEQIGHGHTGDVPGRNFSYEAMTEDTGALLGQLGVRGADVIGWSDGGQIALRLALTHPEQVRRLAVSGVELTAATPEETQRRRRFYERLSPDVWPEARKEHARVSPDGPEHWLTFFAKMRAMWGSPSQGITQGELALIKARTLIIAGDQEDVERHVRIFRGIAGASLCILPGTGHVTFPNRPDWLNPIILDFLDRD